MKLSPNNSFVVEHTVSNPALTPSNVNDATVMFDLKNLDDSPIAGTSFPQQIPFVSGSNGVYKKTFDPIPNLIIGQKYKAVIVTTDLSGMVSTNTTKVDVVRRDFNE